MFTQIHRERRGRYLMNTIRRNHFQKFCFLGPHKLIKTTLIPSVSRNTGSELVMGWKEAKAPHYYRFNEGLECTKWENEEIRWRFTSRIERICRTWSHFIADQLFFRSVFNSVGLFCFAWCSLFSFPLLMFLFEWTTVYKVEGGKRETMNNFICSFSGNPTIYSSASLREEGPLLAAGLVDAAAADVTHPFDHIVIAVVQLRLEDLQVAHFQPWWSEGYLKVHGDGRASPLLFVISG